MFRLTIRELLLMTVSAALGISWWQANQNSQVATADARELADYAASRFGLGNESDSIGVLLKKYRATTPLCTLTVTPRIRIVEEEEEKLGIDFEE